MKAAVRYFSRTNNTKKLAEAIANAIGVPAKDVSVPLEEDTEVVFLGSAVYAAGVDEAVKKFVADNRDKIGTLYNFSTAALLPSTYSQMKKIAADYGVAISDKEFHCRGRFHLLHKSHPDGDDLKAAADFAAGIV